MSNKKNKTFPSKTRKQIAAEYGFDPKTLKSQLERKDLIIPNGIILPVFQKDIYEALGYPNTDVKELFQHF